MELQNFEQIDTALAHRAMLMDLINIDIDRIQRQVGNLEHLIEKEIINGKTK